MSKGNQSISSNVITVARVAALVNMAILAENRRFCRKFISSAKLTELSMHTDHTQKMCKNKLEKSGRIVEKFLHELSEITSREPIHPVSILRKSTSGRHRPVSYPDGPMTVRYRST